MHELLTPDEVAQELRVHPETIRRWCRSGYLPAQRLGRQWRIRREEVERKKGRRR